MAVDLVKSREEVLSPSAPCIIKNLAQVEGGCEIRVSTCDADYPYGVFEQDGDFFPKVLKAGHLVLVDVDEDCKYIAFDIYKGKFGPSDNVASEISFGVGVLTNDVVVNKEGQNFIAYGSVMIMGVVDARKLPAKLSVERYMQDPVFKGNVVFLNLEYVE